MIVIEFYFSHFYHPLLHHHKVLSTHLHLNLSTVMLPSCNVRFSQVPFSPQTLNYFKPFQGFDYVYRNSHEYLRCVVLCRLLLYYTVVIIVVCILILICSPLQSLGHQHNLVIRFNLLCLIQPNFSNTNQLFIGNEQLA